MTTAPANLRVSDSERSEAISMIQAAYADGRLDEPAMERHLELAFAARTRLELHHAVADLRRPGTPPLFAQSLVPPAPRVPQTFQRAGNAALPDPTTAGLTHLSGLLFSVAGPGAVWLVTSPGTPLRREAAKALNFQALVLGAAIVAGVVGLVLNIGILSGLVTLAWLILTIVSGVKAFRNEEWVNPVTALVGKRLVRED